MEKKCEHDTVLEIYTDDTHTKVAHYRCVRCQEVRKSAFGEHIVHDRYDDKKAEKKPAPPTKKLWSEKKMIEVAQQGYDAPLPESYKKALEHSTDIGDGLADFIVTELVEGAEGNRTPEEFARLMRRAAEQLIGVAEEFERHL